MTTSADFKTQRARFTDNKGGLLEIVAKQMKDGSLQVVAFHTPKNGKRMRGCVGSFSDGDQALKRFTSLSSDAEKNKWTRKVRQAVGSAFDVIPKA